MKNKIKSEKHSQASIIVTVLLILVSIAAVTILAAWIIPMVQTSLEARDIRVDISIDKEGTFYNDGTAVLGGCSGCDATAKTYVKLVRGPGMASLYGIKFIFDASGKAFTYINTNIPGELESKTYVFQLYGENKTDSVIVVPIALVNGRKVSLDLADKANIPVSSLTITLDKVEKCSSPVATGGDRPPPPLMPGC